MTALTAITTGVSPCKEKFCSNGFNATPSLWWSLLPRIPVDMIFYLQIQRKREQHMPLYIAFIDLSKMFDFVSRKGLFQLLIKLSCPPQLRSIITFPENIQGVGESSLSFTIQSDVQQVCVLAPILFGILFSMLLSFAFRQVEGVYLYTRNNSKLFNLDRLRAKTKVRTVLIR